MSYFIEIIHEHAPGVEKRLRVPYPSGLPLNDVAEDAAENIQTVYSASVTLTDAQIKALPTTGIEVLAAQAGKLIVPMVAILTVDWTADYTNIDAGGSLQIKDGSNELVFLPIVNSAAPEVIQLTNFLAWGGDCYVKLPPYFYTKSSGEADEALKSTGYVQDVAGFASALTLSIFNGASGNLTVGNAANAIDVEIWYGLKDA